MSRQNGDRSRFQRIRKAGLRRRERARTTHAMLNEQAAAARAAAAPEPQAEPHPPIHLRLV